MFLDASSRKGNVFHENSPANTDNNDQIISFSLKQQGNYEKPFNPSNGSCCDNFDAQNKRFNCQTGEINMTHTANHNLTPLGKILPNS